MFFRVSPGGAWFFLFIFYITIVCCCCCCCCCLFLVNVVNNGGNRLSKKSKKKMLTDDAPGVIQQKVDVDANAQVCQAALHCLSTLLLYCGARMKPAAHKVLFLRLQFCIYKRNSPFLNIFIFLCWFYSGNARSCVINLD